MELFTRFNEVGVTLLIATHDLELVEQLPHRTRAPRCRPNRRRHRAARRPNRWPRSRHYFGLHRDNLVGAVKRLAGQPFASILTILVIATALALPAGLARRRQQRRCRQRLLAERRRLHRLLEDGRRGGRGAANGARRSRNATTSPASPSSIATRRSRSSARNRASARRSMRSTAIHCRTRSSFGPRAGSRATSRRSPKAMEALPETELVQVDTAWVARLRAMLALAGRLVDFATVLLGLAVAIVVGNTIRLEINNRSVEIEVTKLVGGTDGFIRRPFLYLGLCYGLAGAIVALGRRRARPVAARPARCGPSPTSTAAASPWPGYRSPRAACCSSAARSSAGPVPGSRPPATCGPSSRSRPRSRNAGPP